MCGCLEISALGGVRTKSPAATMPIDRVFSRRTAHGTGLAAVLCVESGPAFEVCLCIYIYLSIKEKKTELLVPAAK